MLIVEKTLRRIIRHEIGKIHEGPTSAGSDDTFKKIKEICDAALAAGGRRPDDDNRFRAMIMSALNGLRPGAEKSDSGAPSALADHARKVVAVWRGAWAADVVSVRALAERLGSIPGAGRPAVLPESSVIVVELDGVFLAVPSQQDYELCEKFFDADRTPGRFSTVADLEQPAVFSHAGGGMISRGRVRIDNG